MITIQRDGQALIFKHADPHQLILNLNTRFRKSMDGFLWGIRNTPAKYTISVPIKLFNKIDKFRLFKRLDETFAGKKFIYVDEFGVQWDVILLSDVTSILEQSHYLDTFTFVFEGVKRGES
jgi:hypothetical protein